MLRPPAILLLALVLCVGAGCVRKDTLTETPSPVGYIPLSMMPTSTDSGPVGWERVSFGGAWSLLHPGRKMADTAAPSVERRVREVAIDLGTAVDGAGEKSVPRRTLTIDRLLPGNDFLSLGCVATTTQMGAPSSVYTTTTAQGVGACVRTFSEGAAGSRYHTLSATLITIDAAYVVDYLIRSTECTLYERPEEQCVAFDEARDTALFWTILATLRPGR